MILNSFLSGGYSDLLLQVSQICLIVVATSLFAATIILRKVTSFAVILGLSCFLSFFHQKAEVAMMDIASIPEYAGVIRHFWYLFYGITDLLFVQICLLICTRFDLKSDMFSNIFLKAYLFLAAAQFARWLDRIVFDFDVLGVFYKSIVPLTNVSLSIVSVLALIVVIRNNFIYGVK